MSDLTDLKNPSRCYRTLLRTLCYKIPSAILTYCVCTVQYFF